MLAEHPPGKFVYIKICITTLIFFQPFPDPNSELDRDEICDTWRCVAEFVNSLELDVQSEVNEIAIF